MKIFDLTGRQVRTLYEGKKNPGRYTLSWDGRDFQGNVMSSGIFFLELQIGQQHWMDKLVLLK